MIYTRQLILMLAAVLTSVASFAQDFVPPAVYVLDKPDDYRALHEEVIECAEYLNRIEPKVDSKVKKDNQRFLREWIIGTPDIQVDVNQYLVNLVDRNETLVNIYINGWVCHALRQQSLGANDFGNHMAALNAMLDYYIKFESQLNKDPDLKMLVKKREKNALEVWLRRQLG